MPYNKPQFKSKEFCIHKDLNMSYVGHDYTCFSSFERIVCVLLSNALFTESEKEAFALKDLIMITIYSYLVKRNCI